MKLMVGFRYVFLAAYTLCAVGCTSATNQHQPNDLISAGSAHNSPSREGKMLFVSNQDGDREIFLTKFDGSQLAQLTHNERDDYDARWSPDGKAILFTSLRDNGNSEVYVMQADGNAQQNLSRAQGYDGQARWSPDGRYIAFTSDRHSGVIQLFIMRADGSGLRQITHDTHAGLDAPEWSPNGKWIAYRKLTPDKNKADTWVVNPKTGEEVQLTNNPGHNDGRVSWAPESDRLVYHSRRNREFNIYVYDMNTKKETKLTHLPASDTQPQWSHHSGQILFLSTRGPFGRSQLYVMKEDGSQQRSYSDAQYQVDDATWLADDSGILMVSWQGRRYSNVVALDFSDDSLSVVSPADGYQSQPLPEPVALPQSSKQVARASALQPLP